MKAVTLVSPGDDRASRPADSDDTPTHDDGQARKGPRAEFYGSKGVISLASTADEPPYLIFRDEPEAELRGWLIPERVYRGRLMPPQQGRDVDNRPWSFANGVAHFTNVIEGKEKLVMTPEHARHVLEIMLASYESARSGRAVDLTTSFERET